MLIFWELPFIFHKLRIGTPLCRIRRIGYLYSKPFILKLFDILGTAYITLIGNFASTAGKKGGEFYTPTNMSLSSSSSHASS